MRREFIFTILYLFISYKEYKALILFFVLVNGLNRIHCTVNVYTVHSTRILTHRVQYAIDSTFCSLTWALAASENV